MLGGDKVVAKEVGVPAGKVLHSHGVDQADKVEAAAVGAVEVIEDVN